VVNFQIIILLVVAIVEAGLQEFKEAVILFSVVIVNIIIGFSQEYKAKQALEALMSLSVPGVSHDETMLAEEED
jgi:Ca2+-transporting ATPase